MCTRIKPCKTSLQGSYLQSLLCQVVLVYSGDFQLATWTRLDVLGYLYHAVWIEIESYHSVVALWLGWLLFDAEAVALFVEFSYAISLRIVYIVAEYTRLSLFGSLYTLMEQSGEACAVEDVVSQYQAHVVVADKLFSDDESLSQSVW